MDIKTIFIFLLIIQTFLSIIMAVLWRSQKKFEGFNYYTISNIALSVSYFLFILRGQIPDIISITLGNIILMAVCFYRIESYSSFFQKNTKKYSFAAFIFFSFIAVFFTHVHDSAVARVINLSLFIDVMVFYICILLAKNLIAENKIFYCLGIIINAWLGAVCLARIFVWLFMPELRSIFSSSLFNIFFLISISINDIIGAVVFILINNEKLARELKYANDTKDRFFSIIAHDLMGPIGNIVNMMELFLDEKYKFKEEEKKEIFLNLKKKSQITFELLENLLKWARSQRNEMKYEPAFFEINDIIEKSIEIFKPLADQKKIEIISKFEDKTNVFADLKMVSTILRNLISNAVKFSNENEKITIFTQKIGSSIEITVEDNGVGIDAQTLNKLFKIDENVSTRGTNQEHGTGLGLILCKEFIEKNKGAIRVESEINKGSRFITSLPLNKEF